MISITKLNRFFELNNLSYKSLQHFPHFIISIMLLFYLKLTYFSFKSLSLSLSHFLNIFHFRLRLHTIQRIIRSLSDNAFLCSPGKVLAFVTKKCFIIGRTLVWFVRPFKIYFNKMIAIFVNYLNTLFNIRFNYFPSKLKVIHKYRPKLIRLEICFAINVTKQSSVFVCRLS
jgi:hypothetical protein